jgi:protein-tyrosine-phosphatase
VTRPDSPIGSEGPSASSYRPEHLHEPPSLLTPEAVLHRLAGDLAQRFVGVFSPETVERCVFESYVALERSARIPTHLPALTQRFATDRLRALAQSCGAIAKDVPEVLFVCVHNAGRSQIAAALLDHHGRGRVHVRSAGSSPTDSISPAVADAMAEVGVDITREFPKPLTDDVVHAADVIVTMGCGDACPVYPGKRYLAWAVEDPEGRPLAKVRAIRDDIDSHVQALLAELTELAVATSSADHGTSRSFAVPR